MTRTPEEVFQHHAEALGAGDLDEIVADYADDAVFHLASGRQARPGRHPGGIHSAARRRA
jgi:hypothetical protein